MEEEKTFYKNLYTSILELGLSSSAANLYLLSLKLGPTPITAISKNLGVSRPNTYKLIKDLENFELVKSVSHEKYARDFMVESPTVILEKLRDKRKYLEQLDSGFVVDMPSVLAQYHQGSSLTKIRIFQGKEEYMKLFNKSVEESNSIIKFFGSADDFINFISWKTEHEWIRKRIKNKIFLKALLLPGKDANILKQMDHSQLRETRFLKDTENFSTSFMIFANKLIFWQPNAPLAVLIEDQYIAETMDITYEKIWAMSE